MSYDFRHRNNSRTYCIRCIRTDSYFITLMQLLGLFVTRRNLGSLIYWYTRMQNYLFRLKLIQWKQLFRKQLLFVFVIVIVGTGQSLSLTSTTVSVYRAGWRLNIALIYGFKVAQLRCTMWSSTSTTQTLNKNENKNILRLCTSTSTTMHWTSVQTINRSFILVLDWGHRFYA